MRIEISQNIDKEYYEEYYSQRVQYKSKYWKLGVLFVSILVYLVGYFIYDSILMSTIVAMCLIAIIMYEAYSSKSKMDQK